MTVPACISCEVGSSTSGSTSLNVNNNYGTITDGSRLIAGIMCSNPSGFTVTLSGWTELYNYTDASGLQTVLFTKEASSEPGLSGDWTFEFSSNIGVKRAFVYISDVDVDIIGPSSVGSGDSTVATFPSETTTRNKSRIIRILSQRDSDSVTTETSVPTGYTNRTSGQSTSGSLRIRNSVRDIEHTSVGAVGTLVASSFSDSEHWHAFTILLQWKNLVGIPTDLTRILPSTDTTPGFSANVSGPDPSESLKGRFVIYESDGTTLVGTVDSEYRIGSGTVTVEYSSILTTGTYKVKVATVNSLGAISSYTSQETFYVTTTISEDLTLRWDVKQNITDDVSLRYDVNINNQKDLTLLWDTRVTIEENLDLRWKTSPAWVDIDDTPVLTTWIEVE